MKDITITNKNLSLDYRLVPRRREAIQGDMQDIALRHKCSKADGHSYMPCYEHYTAHLRDYPITLVELGVDIGASMRLWLEWFRHPLTKIYGVDAETGHVKIADDRLTLINMDHNHAALGAIFKAGCADIIVDDGCHHPPVQRRSHELLWPALKPGGMYWVEDINCFPHFYTNDGPGGDCLRHWLTMENSHVWANYMDGFGNYRDDDVLVMVRK